MRYSKTELLLYCVVKYLEIFLQLIGYNLIQVAGDLLGPLAYLLVKSRRRISINNMLMTKVAKNEADAKKLTLLMFSHLVKVVLEIIFLTNRRKSTLKYVKAKNLEVARKVEESAGGIFIFGHYGNWELGATLALYGQQIYSVVRPLQSPVLDDLIQKMRKNKNHIGLPKFGVSEMAKKVIKDKRFLTIDMDQNAGSEGVIVKFFGLDAPTWKTPAILSLRYNVPVIPVKVFRNNSIHYVSICDPIYPSEAEGEGDKIKFLTQKYVNKIEENLREKPYQWLWILRRWKIKTNGTSVNRNMLSTAK